MVYCCGDLLARFYVSAEVSKSEFLRRLCNGIYDHDQIPESKNSLWCSLARSKPYEYFSGSGLKARQTRFIVLHQRPLPLRPVDSTVAFQAVTRPLLTAVAL